MIVALKPGRGAGLVALPHPNSYSSTLLLMSVPDVFRSVSLFLLVPVLLAGCDGLDSGVSPNESAQNDAGPTVQFAANGAGAVPDDGTVSVEVEYVSPDAEATVEVLYATASTTTDDEVTIPRVRELSFPAADTTVTRSFEIDVSDVDISGGAKEALFALQNLRTGGQATIGRRQFDLTIGFPPLANLREEGVGASGLFSAVVTEISGSDVRVQDEDAAIAITRRSDFADAVERGDKVSITGTVSEFAGQLQIDTDDLNSFEVLSSGNDLPSHVTITLPEAVEDFDELENELVRVEGITIDPDGEDVFRAGGSDGNYTVTDDDGNELVLRIPGASFYEGEPIPEGSITVEAALGRFNEAIQLRARYEGDIITE